MRLKRRDSVIPRAKRLKPDSRAAGPIPRKRRAPHAPDRRRNVNRRQRDNDA